MVYGDERGYYRDITLRDMCRRTIHVALDVKEGTVWNDLLPEVALEGQTCKVP